MDIAEKVKDNWFTGSLTRALKKLFDENLSEDVGVEKIAYHLVKTDNNRISQVLASSHIEKKFLLSKLHHLVLEGDGKSSKSQKHEIDKILRACEEILLIKNEHKVSFLIFFEAILQDKQSEIGQLLSDLGIKTFFISAFLDSNSQSDEKLNFSFQEEISKVNDFCTNLNDIAASGKLEPAFHREAELNSLMKILCRFKKNNALIIGEPGVGKTAIVYELVNRLVSSTGSFEVPESLKHCHILSLDPASLMAGTSHTGELEQKLKLLIDVLVGSKGKMVLFIDEFHTLAGIGRGDSPLNAINTFKPYLLRGDFRVIGATTQTEFRQYIEKDEALTRRFEKVIVKEPGLFDAYEMVEKGKKPLEMHYGLKISASCSKLAVDLANRYIHDKKLPDKAFDLLDLACSDAYSAKSSDGLLPDHLYSVIESKTEIPKALQKGDLHQAISSLSEYLCQNIVSQRNAIDKICKTFRRNFVFPDENEKPVGSFLFLGPTGVGKTEMAKLIAKKLFYSRESFIRIDMSELSQSNQVARLIGSPPGYIGYEEGGYLTNAVYSNPFSLILVDEFEKAHPDVFPIFLQILDDGRLTDGKGKTVYFNNCVIIATSNLDVTNFAQGLSLGFLNVDENVSSNEDERIRKDLKQLIPPELVNRFDAVLKFESLNQIDIEKIIELKLKILCKKFKKKNISVAFSSTFATAFSKRFTDNEFGARQIARVIASDIEDLILDQLFNKQNDGHVNLHVDLKVDDVVQVKDAGKRQK